MSSSSPKPDPKGPILILGGTDKVGSRIASQLDAAGVPALVASPSGEAPPSKFLRGVRFDWLDPSTYQNPFEAAGKDGIRAVYVIPPPILDSAPPVLEFINRAITEGTRRFILQSATAVETGGTDMGRVHAYVRDLGTRGMCDWAALRPTSFQENFAEDQPHRESIKKEGKIYSATDRGMLPFVSADDVAAAAVKLLTQSEPPHTEYTLLGSQNLTYDEVAEILGDVLGKKVKHDSLSREGLERRLQSYGMPEDESKVMSELDHRVSLQKEHRWNDTIETLLERKPRDFRTFAESAKAVWQ